MGLVYIDESGNDGANYHLATKPVFTMVALDIDRDSETYIIESFNKAVNDLRIQSDEIHAKNLRPHVLSALAHRVLDLFFEYNCKLFASICERRYVVASFVESDFLDPIYNSLCDNSYTYPVGKSERADMIYKAMSDESFVRLAKAFREGQEMDSAHSSLCNNLEENGEHELARLILGAKDKLSMIESEIKDIDNNKDHFKKRGVFMSPNWFSLSGILNKLEHYGNMTGEENEIVFDSAAQYDQDFADYFNRLKNLKPERLFLGKGIPHYFGYRYNKSFRTESSSANRMLQIVDVFATFINKLYVKISEMGSKAEYTEAEHYCLAFITMAKREFDSLFVDMVVSSRLMVNEFRVIEKKVGSER